MSAGTIMEQVMRTCCNFFETGYMEGAFTIADSILSPAPEGRWVYISGSTACDGVHSLSSSGLLDDAQTPLNDAFSGRVWVLNPPGGFLSLCEEVAEYAEKNPTGAMQSESFGNYSYTKAANTWADAFSSKLSPWRKMFTEVG